jgi:hypothetical protein
MPLDPATATLRGRIGAYVQHSRHDPRETTRAARSAFLARFECQVDPQGLLPEPERRRRAESARKAHFARMAFLSARARRRAGAEASHA